MPCLPLPQVIARIHTTSLPVRRLIHSLLVRVGRHHPQALMYPLLVACKSQSPARRAAAMSVVDSVRQHSPTLVEQVRWECPDPRPGRPLHAAVHGCSCLWEGHSVGSGLGGQCGRGQPRGPV